MKWETEKDKLFKYIVEDKLSYEEIGRLYGCSGVNIKKVAKRLEIPLEQRRSINPTETFNKKKHYCLNCGKELDTNRQYCNSQCQSEYKYNDYINKWKSGEVSGHDVRYKISPYVRKYLLTKYNNCCQLCDCNWVNPKTGLSILQIHHIDGNAANCKEDNLQLLCPNHHAMTENFGSLNDSSIREYRKEDYLKQEQSVKQLN